MVIRGLLIIFTIDLKSDFMTIIERFLKYVSFDTQSDESAGVTPSTEKQMVFARYLKTELEELGLKDISLDENGYLFATLPSNVSRPIPVIGFIAHMSTIGKGRVLRDCGVSTMSCR